MTYRNGRKSGNGTPSTVGNGTGFFNYQNTLANPTITTNTWSTLQNNALGALTSSAFAPDGVTSMLDTVTGRILLNQLEVGDQVYIKHLVNITPFTNGMTIDFRHFIGQTGQEYALPFGPVLSLNAGAGTPSGLLAVETQLYIRDSNTKIGGILPQIRGNGTFLLEYTSVYISVTRRLT